MPIVNCCCNPTCTFPLAKDFPLNPDAPGYSAEGAELRTAWDDAVGAPIGSGTAPIDSYVVNIGRCVLFQNFLIPGYTTSSPVNANYVGGYSIPELLHLNRAGTTDILGLVKTLMRVPNDNNWAGSGNSLTVNNDSFVTSVSTGYPFYISPAIGTIKILGEDDPTNLYVWTDVRIAFYVEPLGGLEVSESHFSIIGLRGTPFVPTPATTYLYEEIGRILAVPFSGIGESPHWMFKWDATHAPKSSTPWATLPLGDDPNGLDGVLDGSHCRQVDDPSGYEGTPDQQRESFYIKYMPAFFYTLTPCEGEGGTAHEVSSASSISAPVISTILPGDTLERWYSVSSSMVGGVTLGSFTAQTGCSLFYTLTPCIPGGGFGTTHIVKTGDVISDGSTVITELSDDSQPNCYAVTVYSGTHSASVALPAYNFESGCSDGTCPRAYTLTPCDGQNDTITRYVWTTDTSYTGQTISITYPGKTVPSKYTATAGGTPAVELPVWMVDSCGGGSPLCITMSNSSLFYFDPATSMYSAPIIGKWYEMVPFCLQVISTTTVTSQSECGNFFHPSHIWNPSSGPFDTSSCV